MPDPYERHGQPGDGWSRQPSRSQLRRMAATDGGTAKRPPGRKDPALCKAAHWKGPHRPEIRASKGMRPECRWDESWTRSGELAWRCIHEEVCADCGKLLRFSVGRDECPDFHPVTDAERARIEASAARFQEWKVRTRPVISGRQGYRKRKGA